MNSQESSTVASDLAKMVAGEDLRVGDFVAMLNEVVEFPSFFWCCDSGLLPPHETVRIQWKARSAGEPLKVKAICLPFVLVKKAGGKCRTLDIRQCQLVKLSPRFAKKAYKAFKKPKKSSRAAGR